MTNAEIAAVFSELANRLSVVEENAYRFMAYRKAADTLRKVPISVEALAREGRLQELEGVGPAIAQKIAELLETGSFKALDRARQVVPDGLLQLTRAEGVGRKTALRIWEEMGARTFDDLLDAARNGLLTAIPGVGEKTVVAILDAGEKAAEPEQRPDHLLMRSEASELGKTVANLLRDGMDSTGDVCVVGAFVRGHELTERVELLLVADDDAAAMGEACDVLGVCGWQAEPLDMGKAASATWHRAVLQAPNGIPVDLHVADRAHAAVAFLHAVGPEGHAHAVVERVGTRRVAVREPDAAHFDEPVYAAAKLQYVPFELRDRPEVVELAAAHALPELVELGDLRADVHCHSTWSDGRARIIEMAQAALERGDTHMAITDHSQPLAMVNGLDPDRLAAQREEIAAANAELAGEFTVLQGSEVEILPDGRLGLDDDTLARLDWAVASLHVSQRQSADEIKARMEPVLRNPFVDLIGHPTSRLLLRRPPTALDVEWLVALAVETGTFLEINADPRRLDLNADNARMALEAGVLLSVNSDAHRTKTLALREHGVVTARRAGATAAQVVNTFDLAALRDRQKRNRA